MVFGDGRRNGGAFSAPARQDGQVPETARHLSTAELDAGVDHIRAAPREIGRLELIVRRPAVDEREILDAGELDLALGLVGDSWSTRPSKRSADGGPHPDMQLNVMSSRAAALIGGPADRWALAGDQLFVDLDLSDATVPPGTRLRLGDAVIEVTDQPHRGCAKFAERFGQDAVRFVNSEAGRELHLRGINAKVVVAGRITTGDEIRVVPAAVDL